MALSSISQEAVYLSMLAEFKASGMHAAPYDLNMFIRVLVSAPGLIAWFRKDDWVDGTKNVNQVVVH